jgi:DNA repair exonuclease SbcCD nuclease subunit
MTPYLLVSDIHANGWSQFATNDGGMNSRLHKILDELMRAAYELKDRGGDMMVVAGDLFHKRGSIEPEVFNPVFNVFSRIVNIGIKVHAIPGNHDLASKETTMIGNAMQSLEKLPGFSVHTEPTLVYSSDGSAQKIAFIPWHATEEGLLGAVEKLKDLTDVSGCDLIAHFGIDGVLSNVSGYSAKEAAGWGFNRVLSGHYHHHAVLEGGKVISIGATTQHTWEHIGTKAGFLFVYPDHIEFRASRAPSFVEINADIDPDEYPLIVDGNYVRVRSMKLNNRQINELRSAILEMGAKGVSFQVAVEATTSREGSAAVGKATTLDESVASYIDSKSVLYPDELKAECADILTTVRSVVAA